MKLRLFSYLFYLAGVFFFLNVALVAVGQPSAPAAQPGFATLRGQVADPSGAVVPMATISVTSSSGMTVTAISNPGGGYEVKGLAAGEYTVSVVAKGFAVFISEGVTVTAGQVRRFDIPLQIATEKQQVMVTEDAPTVDVSPDSNASSLVIKGKDLDALSDDPDELSSELSALAGPSAGPNGGQIYIDGFTGGQLPPKSAIREIRVNQNPFSAEYDKLGYGRIEILTKPGTDKLHGQALFNANLSNLNSKNPFATAEPDYHTLQYNGTLSGAISKKSSFFFSIDQRNIQDVNVINAFSLDSTFAPVSFTQSVLNPRTRTNLSPRLDYQLSANNTLTARYQFNRIHESNDGIGQFSLASQGYNQTQLENTLQISDTQVFGPKIVNETRFEYERDRNTQNAQSALPELNVQGLFTGGGNPIQSNIDKQDHYELQNYTSIALASHFVKFGGRLRDTRDSNTSTGSFNGNYTFTQASYVALQQGLANGQSLESLIAAGYGPSQYTVTYLGPRGSAGSKVNVVDVGLYLQDDWKARPNFTFSYGLRYETQNAISDHANFGPRFSFAYGIGGGKTPPKTVVRGGYGWFYDRFQVAQVLQANRLNGLNQLEAVVTRPTFYNPDAATNPSSDPPLAGARVTDTIYQIAPGLKAPITMQAAIGVDRQLTKTATVSLTYLNSRGLHQLLTRNSNAPGGPEYDPAGGNVYQYYSEALFKQNQLIANFNVRVGTKISLFGFYQLGKVNSNSAGASSNPSNQYNLRQDYGRAGFDIHNRLFVGGTFTAPLAIRLSPFVVYNSGAPFNITIPEDINGDSFFNDRPSFATADQCGQTGIVCNAKYGDFNTNPGAGIPIPINYGQGPGEFAFNLRLSKTIGFGPKTTGSNANGGSPPGGGGRGGPGGPGGGLGPRGLGGGGGGNPFGGAAVNRRYNLTFNVAARNLFNNVNPAVPVGVLGSQKFGQSNALVGGFFNSSSANRRIDLQAVFSF